MLKNNSSGLYVPPPTLGKNPNQENLNSLNTG